MPKYKDSPEVRAAKKKRKDKLRELLNVMEVENFNDLQSLFKEMVGEVLENGLEAELDEELGYSKYDYKNKDTENSRNGHSRKTLKTSAGALEIAVPRDRDGDFEPQIVKKNETTLSGDIEEKIISMYAKGMTTSDISMHIEDIYGIEVSDSLVSRITDKILPIVKEWQQRQLESICAVVFMDAIHYHVRCEGRIVKRAAYIAIGINKWTSEAKKETINQEFRERGIDLEALKAEHNMADVDDFDFICHVAYDAKLLTRRERANNVKKRDFLSKYSGDAKAVLEALLEKYADSSVYDIEKTDILKIDPLNRFGKPSKIAQLFGGKDGYFMALRELENTLYNVG